MVCRRKHSPLLERRTTIAGAQLPRVQVCLSLLIAIVFWSVSAHAGSSLPNVSITGGEDRLPFASSLQVLEDPRGDFDLVRLRAGETKWTRWTSDTLAFGASPSVWWMRQRVTNTTDRPQPTVFDLGTANQDFVHWYVLDSSGIVVLDRRAGARLPHPTGLPDSRLLALPFTVPAHAAVDLYVRFATRDGLFELMPISLSSAPAFAARQRVDDILLSLYHGGLLALACFNLLLFLSTREKSFGFYVAYLLVFCVNSFCFRGFDLQYLWPGAPDLHFRLIGCTAGLSFATGGLFIANYLKLRDHAKPWLRFLIGALITMNVLGAALGALDHYRLAALCALIFGLALLGTCYFCAIWLMAKGVRTARFIVFAFSALLTSVAAYYLEGLGLISLGGLSIWGLQIGSGVEMLTLAFGIADRLNTLKVEKFQAESEALEAQRTLTGRLETLVEQRTSELATANAHLRHLAVTDELTGAFNRRRFNEAIAETFDRGRRSDPIALCILDIDYFKRFNDSNGHVAGDRALRAVAGAIQAELRRSSDALFRLGGEEFGVLFTATTADAARRFVERLRRAVINLRIPHEESPSGIVTASFGIIWWDRDALDGLSPETMVSSVDRLLYEAKEKGRNRTESRPLATPLLGPLRYAS